MNGEVRDYRDDLGEWLKAKLLELSAFFVDVEERARQEQVVRDCVAEWFGPVGMIAYRSPSEGVPPLPHFGYPDAGHDAGEILALDDAMIRELVRREEQQHLWPATVEAATCIAGQFIDGGFSISGDDRPDVRGMMRP